VCSCCFAEHVEIKFNIKLMSGDVGHKSSCQIGCAQQQLPCLMHVDGVNWAASYSSVCSVWDLLPGIAGGKSNARYEGFACYLCRSRNQAPAVPCLWLDAASSAMH
jgi:hypothetical protein